MKKERASLREMRTILSERSVPFTKAEMRSLPRSVRRSVAASARQNGQPTKE